MNPIQIDNLNYLSGTDYEHLYTKLLFNIMIIDSDALEFNSSRQITGVMALLYQGLTDKPANIHFKVSEPQSCLFWKTGNGSALIMIYFKFRKNRRWSQKFSLRKETI